MPKTAAPTTPAGLRRPGTSVASASHPATTGLHESPLTEQAVYDHVLGVCFQTGPDPASCIVGLNRDIEHLTTALGRAGLRSSTRRARMRPGCRATNPGATTPTSPSTRP